MSSDATQKDFDVLKTLWTEINNFCVPPPPPGQDPKAFFLMESPGFSVDPDVYDPTKFDPGIEMSPECAVATLCDRIPALAPFYYDTGNHISFFWKILLSTFTIEGEFEKKNDAIKARYEHAIKMLYGGPEGYVAQTKTPLFDNLKKLREAWKVAENARERFKDECKKQTDLWPGNYEVGAAPYIDAVEQAYTEYNNLKLEIEKYEAAIFAYAMGDLTTVILDEETKMARQRRDDAGNTGTTFYNTTLNPANWYKWFSDAAPAPVAGVSSSSSGPSGPSGPGASLRAKVAEDDDSEEIGWTKLSVHHTKLSKSTNDTFSKLSVEIGASYGGLVSVSGGYGREQGDSFLSSEGSNLEIEFKVRKVTIDRQWLDLAILHYPIIGIKGLEETAWSNGEFDSKTNLGSFPLLPTAMIVAKDIVIKSQNFSQSLKDSIVQQSVKSSVKVGIGPFSAQGNFGFENGSKSSNSEFSDDGTSLTVKGAQIIGWVCTAVPYFPNIDCRLTKPEEPKETKET